MIAGSITIFILSLILPVSGYSFPGAAAGYQSVGIDFGGRVPALGYLDENLIKNEPTNYTIRWHKRKEASTLNGVALIIHGLNCRPGKMESIIAELTEVGIECLNLSLRGHGENYPHRDSADDASARMEAFKSVTYPLWKTEAYQAYQRARRKSNLSGAPLFFIGFSMGGLIGVDLFASNPSVEFDKMVLFAPALKMHRRNSLLKVLSPFPGMVVPSFAHESYLANDGTPMAAYNALFEMHAHFENNLDPRINIPTIVFADRQDELISFSGLYNMILDQNLDQWRILPVKKDEIGTEVKMHHIIIDEASVGRQMWQKMVKTTITHLLKEASSDTREK